MELGLSMKNDQILSPHSRARPEVSFISIHCEGSWDVCVNRGEGGGYLISVPVFVFMVKCFDLHKYDKCFFNNNVSV